VHALEDHLAFGALHQQHALVAQHARAIHLHQAAEELVELGAVERLRALENKGGDIVAVLRMVVVCMAAIGGAGVAVLVRMLVLVAVRICVLICVPMRMVVRFVMIMHVRRFGGEEIRVQFQLFVQVETADVEHLGPAARGRNRPWRWGRGD